MRGWCSAATSRRNSRYRAATRGGARAVRRTRHGQRSHRSHGARHARRPAAPSSASAQSMPTIRCSAAVVVEGATAPLPELLAARDGVFGVVVNDLLLDRLGPHDRRHDRGGQRQVPDPGRAREPARPGHAGPDARHSGDALGRRPRDHRASSPPASSPATATRCCSRTRPTSRRRATGSRPPSLTPTGRSARPAMRPPTWRGSSTSSRASSSSSASRPCWSAASASPTPSAPISPSASARSRPCAASARPMRGSWCTS